MNNKHVTTKLKITRRDSKTGAIVYIRDAAINDITASEIAIMFGGSHIARQDYFANLFANAPETLRQRDKLLAFAKHCIEAYCFDIQDPDGLDIEDKAEELGLIKEVVATADHYDPEYSDFEIGDTIYEFADFMDK